MKRVVLCVLIAIYLMIALYFKPWESITAKSSVFEIVLSVAAIITLLGVVGCCVGMLLGFDLCRKWYLFFNGVFFLFGCYVVYIYWTFWIFRPPTITERIQSTILPFMLGVVMPLGLFVYFSRKSVIGSLKR